MIKSSHHYALLALAIVVTMFISGVYMYMHYNVNKLLSRAALAKDIVRVEEDNKSHEKDIQKLYESTTESRAKLKQILVPADQIVTIIEHLESLGSKTGSEVNISDIDAYNFDTAKSKKTGLLEVHIEAKGPWSSIMRVLLLAEVMPYLSKIDNVRLSSSVSTDNKKPGKIWMVAFDIDITIVAPNSSTASVRQ